MEDTNHQQYATDLISVLNCPPLISNAPYAVDDAWLARFRNEATIPHQLKYQGNRRLGFYYQWLWMQLIKAHPHYELVAEEIQLKWEKQTLGAIDFLVKNLRTGLLEHWEIAIKFYLAYQHCWPGPNARDSLDKKIDRMINHQLKLCDHPAYQSQLAAKYGQPEIKRLIMQGRLFYPFHSKSSGSEIGINPKALAGSWCFRSQAKKLNLMKINKRHWISPPHYHTLNCPIELAQLNEPTQAIAPDDHVWFIVPEHWPSDNKTS